MDILTEKAGCFIETQPSFSYSSWQEFQLYRPYSLNQWKSSVLFWWSFQAERSMLYLYYMPESSKSFQDYFSVSIGIQPDDSKKEILQWLCEMKPKQWVLEN